MDKSHQSRRPIYRKLLLALLIFVCTAKLPAQATKPDSNPATNPQVSAPSEGKTEPAAADAKPEHVPPPSLEQIRQTQIQDDTKKLYRLSAELRAEVAKTYKESLSLTVLKKAQEVETLARNLKVLISKEAAAKH